MSGFDDVLKEKAVALKYDPSRDEAPVIVASGMGYMARRITEAAMEAGVPVYEDDSLASMLSRLKRGASIPPELYQVVVDIYIYFLRFSLPGNQAEKEEDKREGAQEYGTDEAV